MNGETVVFMGRGFPGAGNNEDLLSPRPSQGAILQEIMIGHNKSILSTSLHRATGVHM